MSALALQGKCNEIGGLELLVKKNTEGARQE